jgi:hypothetical protein
MLSLQSSILQNKWQLNLELGAEKKTLIHKLPCKPKTHTTIVLRPQNKTIFIIAFIVNLLQLVPK